MIFIFFNLAFKTFKLKNQELNNALISLKKINNESNQIKYEKSYVYKRVMFYLNLENIKNLY